MKIKETDLYEPIKQYLEKQGYEVHSEVLFCDIIARKKNEIIIIELKTVFSMNLLIQAVKRLEFSDSVYTAFPVINNKYPSNFSGIKRVLKRLEIGLIVVHFLKTKIRIEIVFHPSEFFKRKRVKKQKQIIREMDGRYKDFNLAGSVSKKEKITAYKLSALKIACFLEKLKESSPGKLIKYGTSMKTQSILSQNYYGWFERVKRGVYRLHPHGKLSLQRYKEIIQHFRKEFRSVSKNTRQK